MEILNNRKPEINPFAGEQSSINQTVIYLDKWANQAKANKAAYEASKENLSELLKKIDLYAISEVNWVIDNFPANLAQYSYPHLVINDKNKVFWNKEALLLVMKKEYQVKEAFKKWIGNELLEYIGIGKDEQERLIIENGWIWWDVLSYGLKKYHDLDY